MFYSLRWDPFSATITSDIMGIMGTKRPILTYADVVNENAVVPTNWEDCKSGGTMSRCFDTKVRVRALSVPPSVGPETELHRLSRGPRLSEAAQPAAFLFFFFFSLQLQDGAASFYILCVNVQRSAPFAGATCGGRRRSESRF